MLELLKTRNVKERTNLIFKDKKFKGKTDRKLKVVIFRPEQGLSTLPGIPTRCAILGKLLNFSGHQFLRAGISNHTFPWGCWWTDKTKLGFG